MLFHRGIRAVLLLLAVAFVGCTEKQDVLTGPDLAKGGNKGKGGAVTLWEYWVTPANDVHVVFKGDVDRINAGVVYDYFHDGFRGGDHFEFGHSEPPSMAPDGPSGFSHADLPWNGERSGILFRDQPATDLDGSGADPFAFFLGYVRGKTGTTIATPKGVVSGGVTGSASEFVDGGVARHTVTTVKSYTTFQGASSAGHEAWIDVLTATPSCVLETVTTGRGRNRTTVTQQVVTAPTHAEIDSDAGPAAAWMEFHLVVDSGQQPRTTFQTYDGTADLNLEATIESSATSVDVSVELDYVYPTADLVYNPASNVPSTTWAVQTMLLDGTWPVASTATETVLCN